MVVMVFLLLTIMTLVKLVSNSGTMSEVDFLAKWFTEANLEHVCYLTLDPSDSDLDNMISIDDYKTFLTSKDLIQNRCDLGKKSLIVINNAENSIGFNINEVLNSARQDSLRNSLWMVRSSNATSIDRGPYSRRFGLRIQLIEFIGNPVEKVFQHQGLGTDMLQKVDLGLPNEIDVQKLLNDLHQRSNFNGIDLKVNYANFPPFANKVGDGPISGMFPDALKVLAKNANLTLKVMEPLPEHVGIWSSLLPDGGVGGLLGEVVSARVDTSLAGFQVTEHRQKFADFTMIGFNTRVTVLVRRPKETDFSLRYYYQEFTNSFWISLVIIYFAIWIMMSAIIFYLTNKRIPSVKNALLTGFALCTRAFINKGSWNLTQTWAFRISFFSILVMGMTVWIHYISQLNANLNVKVMQLPLSSYEDLVNSDFKFLLWTDTANEHQYKFSPKGSIRREVYEKKLKLQGPDDSLNSLGMKGAIDKVLKGEAVVYVELENFSFEEEYPCSIIDVPQLESFVPQKMPFTKESPFFDIVEEMLFDMESKGIMNQIHQRYKTYPDHECTSRKTRLGYEQTLAPFLCLLGGILFSLLMTFMEYFKTQLKNHNQRQSSPEESQDIVKFYKE